MKRTSSMAEIYSNDDVAFERTFQLLSEHLGYPYVQTKELPDRILIIQNAVSSLASCKYHAGVLRCCHSAGAHSRLLCLQQLQIKKEVVSSELHQDREDHPCSKNNLEQNENLPMATRLESMCTISYCNYFAVLIIHCRKRFAVLIVCCTKIFANFIFVAFNKYENILTMKISRFTVLLQYVTSAALVSCSACIIMTKALQTGKGGAQCHERIHLLWTKAIQYVFATQSLCVFRSIK